MEPGAGAIDVYVAVFLARCRRAQRAEQRLIDAPGLHGLGPSASGRVTLLVTDDQARDMLLGLMRDGRAGTVRVAANAPRCGRLLHDAGWTATPVTAMIRRELRTLPSAPLPDELQLRDVDREAQGARDRVALADAVALAVRADPRIVESPDAMTDLLRSLPAVHLLAAVDLSGVVRATSGARVHDTDATVFFVHTDRGRDASHPILCPNLVRKPRPTILVGRGSPQPAHARDSDHDQPRQQSPGGLETGRCVPGPCHPPVRSQPTTARGPESGSSAQKSSTPEAVSRRGLPPEGVQGMSSHGNLTDEQVRLFGSSQGESVIRDWQKVGRQLEQVLIGIGRPPVNERLRTAA